MLLFVRDGLHSVADYNSTLIGVVVVLVVVLVKSRFSQWDNLNALSYQVDFLHGILS